MKPSQLAAMSAATFAMHARGGDEWTKAYYLAQVMPLREWLVTGLKTALAMEIMGRKDWREVAEQAGQYLVRKRVLTRSRSKKFPGEKVFRLSKKWWSEKERSS